MLSSVETIESINTLVENKTPFLFIISFDGENNLVLLIDQLAQNHIFFQTPHAGNLPIQIETPTLDYFQRNPISFQEYQFLFDKVIDEIHKGNTFLLNLTIPTEIKCNLNLYEIFAIAQAKFKLFCNNRFACFSPESFISIENGVISTFPMKGTIRADVPNALHEILNNAKETAEHATIVDLLRNDLSIVAGNVHVEYYRYADLVQTNYGPIYQISSKISGAVKKEFQDNLGELIFSLLPAGSVTGAPKNKTVKIIQNMELCPRDYYTGVFGIWDTKKLESAVMIRFIRNDEGKLNYHCGGGITFQSHCLSEYNEVIDKIYVPVC
jgi:para-aminobenzoate synthetase component 1